jgi:ferric-dicitrate binding protein FerR (iron transport regulator)
MKNIDKNIKFDTDKAWNQLQDRLTDEGLLVEHNTSPKLNQYGMIFKIAAILVLGLFIAALGYYYKPEKERTAWQLTEGSSPDQIQRIQLHDGSLVFLNKGAKLKYPEKFSPEQRMVEFEGEAFFDIVHNPEQPFIITTKGAEIKVLGTSFNVNTWAEYKDIEVLVETGKVELTNIKDKQISMTIHPGYIGALHQKELSYRKNEDKNYLSWKTRYFDFTQGIRLGEAIKILNKAYHVNISCKDKNVSDKILNTTFDNKPLKTVLELICDAHSLKIEEQNGTIILSE